MIVLTGLFRGLRPQEERVGEQSVRYGPRGLEEFLFEEGGRNSLWPRTRSLPEIMEVRSLRERLSWQETFLQYLTVGRNRTLLTLSTHTLSALTRFYETPLEIQ